MKENKFIVTISWNNWHVAKFLIVLRTKIKMYSYYPHFPAVHLTILFPQYHPFADKYISILSTNFLLAVSNSFGISPKIVWVSWIIWASVSKFQLCSSSHFKGGNKQKSHSLMSRLYGGCYITSMLWSSSHSCTRAVVCGQALSW